MSVSLLVAGGYRYVKILDKNATACKVYVSAIYPLNTLDFFTIIFSFTLVISGMAGKGEPRELTAIPHTLFTVLSDRLVSVYITRSISGK